MADLQALKAAVDELSTSELEDLYRHIEERRRRTWWIVPAENLAKIDEIMRAVHEEAAQMSEDEVNEAIDEALAEVRRDRKANRDL
jgi:hypothetical protein